jgi:hypothetical protein
MEKLLVIIICLILLYAIWRNKLYKTDKVLLKKNTPQKLPNPSNNLILSNNISLTPFNNPNNGAVTIPVLAIQPNGQYPLDTTKKGYDKNEADLYEEKYWELKPEFSDIYNYEDQGGLDITHAIDKNPSITVVFEKAPVSKDKFLPTQINEVKLESAGNSAVLDYEPDSALTFMKPQEILKKDLNNFKIPNKINDNENIYNLLGSANNDHYDQKYVIYESPEITDPTNLKNIAPTFNENLKWLKPKIMSYILVTFHDNKINIVHRIAPRNKIEIGDVVYLSMGTFELGPLDIRKI